MKAAAAAAAAIAGKSASAFPLLCSQLLPHEHMWCRILLPRTSDDKPPVRCKYLTRNISGPTSLPFAKTSFFFLKNREVSTCAALFHYYTTSTFAEMNK
jgi:hypothetical protein